jgi:hypothetical protein
LEKGRIILKSMYEKWDGGMEPSIWLMIRRVGGLL